MNESKIKVSVLVPIYNVEKYLQQCLESLLRQTLKEIEIICINDGSTDTSLSIIQRYKSKDERIVLLNKKNSGYGDSMNKGLSLAKGEYIAILESDDFAEQDLLGKLYSLAKENSLDVIKGNYRLYWSDGKTKNNKWNREILEANIIGSVVNPKDHTEICLIPPSIWSGLYKRSFLMSNKIQFHPSPGASYQDTGFAFKVWASASKVMLIDYAGINYRQDNGASSMNTVSRYKVFCLDDEYEIIIKYLKEKGVFDIFSKALYRYMLGTIAWNIGRMPENYLDDYIKKQKEKFSAMFIKKDYLLMFNQASLGNKMVWYSIKYNNKFLLYVYRACAKISRR